MTAVQEAFKNAFAYEGRASRSAYWWYVLAQGVVFIVLDIIIAAAHAPALSVLVYLLAVAAIVVSLPLTIRRLHDSDKSGWWILIDLIPFIGGIWLLVLLCQPSTPGPNRFGLKA
jgi:uncharacterized membrane protein YhaH (DUF805 family)